MQFLRVTMIYATLALGMTTVWALGYQSQRDAELARASRLGPAPETLAAAARAAALCVGEDDESPTTRPAPDLIEPPDEPAPPTSDASSSRPGRIYSIPCSAASNS